MINLNHSLTRTVKLKSWPLFEISPCKWLCAATSLSTDKKEKEKVNLVRRDGMFPDKLLKGQSIFCALCSTVLYNRTGYLQSCSQVDSAKEGTSNSHSFRKLAIQFVMAQDECGSKVSVMLVTPYFISMLTFYQWVFKKRGIIQWSYLFDRFKIIRVSDNLLIIWY